MTVLPPDITTLHDIDFHTGQASKIIGLSGPTIRKLADEKLLPCRRKAGGARTFKYRDLITYRDGNLARYGSVQRPRGRPRKR